MALAFSGVPTYGAEKIKIYSWGEGANVFIGSFCSIAANVQCILGGNHRTDWATTYPFGHVHNDVFKLGAVLGGRGHPVSKGHIIIGNDVWIGINSTLMSGINIGDGAVIGAGAVVASDIPPYAIACGNPAKVIKYRFEETIVSRLTSLGWWDFPDNIIEEIVPFLQQFPTHANLNLIQSIIDSRLSEHDEAVL